MGTRKNAIYLSAAERDDFLQRLLLLKSTPSAEDPGINRYDQFVALHRYVRDMNVPGPADNVDMAHGNAAFLPWHRYYLLRFEQALQEMIPAVPFALPYWDWTDHAGTENVLFQDDFMGPDGTGGPSGTNVMTGYFAFNAPAMPPPWWPAGLPGWRIRTSLNGGLTNTLRRNLGPFANLTLPADVDAALSAAAFGGAAGFRAITEAAARMHNFVHVWFGNGTSHMRDSNISPNDPMFWLHHCNVDRLWAMWQIDGHAGGGDYPGPGAALPAGHDEDDPMWPWVGNLAGYASNNQLGDISLPDFSGEPAVTPADVLDHRALGYSYDTEVIFGLALDQTGSMTGPTPDPMTGMGSVSKWEAAKQGVAAFLQDCEAAYAARVAYVTAGVETFRSLPPNVFTPVFAGIPYGLVRTGTDYSRAEFDAAIAGQLPSGGTPLAAALVDTENSLVRPPFGEEPLGDQRYLAILTDGIETAPPGALDSLSEAPPEFPDSVIFAMGFGMGGGWDGVNYATIENLTQKGMAAPAGVDPVFHGENPGAIDKFFTQSLAAALGYDPMIDPSFELFPGEHLHLPFDATDRESAFLITVQGFDFTDEHWAVCLMSPDGAHCLDTRGAHHGHGRHEAATCCAEPYRVTLRRGRGRFTMFLERGGAAATAWVGSWALMIHYRPERDHGSMQMPGLGDLLLPAGAPPIRGPIYTRAFQSAAQIRAVRATPGRPAHGLVNGVSGLSDLATDIPPCAVAVQIYGRSTLKARLSVAVAAPFAGEDFTLRLQLSDLAGGQFDPPYVVARIIGPAHCTGNAFADLETISPRARRKYLSFADRQVMGFDHLRYLADYEAKRPGAFAIRDDLLHFEPDEDGGYRARVTGNRFPGVYRVAVYVCGRLRLPEPEDLPPCCRRKPQGFSRVLSLSVPLGLRLDAAASRPILHWVARDRWVITVTPSDRHGNVADPARGAEVQALLCHLPLKGEPVNPYTGERRVELRLKGEEFTPTADGQSVANGPAFLATVVDDEAVIQPGEAVDLALRISGVRMAVRLPRLVGNHRTRKAYGAGTPDAMRIALEHRAVFFTAQEAEDAGYAVH